MNLVLGVTVGASAVRLARPGTPDNGGPVFRSRAIERGREIPEDIAADSIRVALAEFTGQDNVVAVVYRDQNQAGALTNALDRGLIDHYQLVPESTAILRMLEEPGTLGTQNTLVIVDLGSTGSTVDVIDRASGSTVVTARSSQVAGDRFDALVYRDQTERRRIVPPTDPESIAELQSRCRLAKEQLSTRSAVCLPGPGGLLLLSREVFDSLVAPFVEALAREVREVVATSGRHPDAVVLIGGGARIPIIRTVLEMWLEVPVIAPEQPDLLAAQGAALLAEGPTDRTVAAAPVAQTVSASAVAPIFAPYPIHTPAAVPEPVEAFAHGGLATTGRVNTHHRRPSVEPTDPSVPDAPAVVEVTSETESAVVAVAPLRGAVDEHAEQAPVEVESVMVDAPAYSAMPPESITADAAGGQPSWVASTIREETTTEDSRKPFRFAGLGAGVVAAIVIVGLGMGYGGKVFGDSGEANPVVTEVTTTVAPSTTVPPPTTTTPPPSTTTVEPPPPVVEQQPAAPEPYVEPYVPPPPPPPALYIPGLPPILLPVLPAIPGF
ncbi:Hsp70 family protein [Rhodococcus sp. IEGM 1379]|uniref:Hsp70 family protein n=1 Tax=Rhodococcus sp. IEGM 1379 TaxID=3047086 RepID=UPI0024B7F6D7|nr:Hsp70 family protein [Rhodococcus sp. IEGM 1379]MDI9915084.1 Hsp70 family protein [Rhodococcus sp. IEGM 1379]